MINPKWIKRGLEVAEMCSKWGKESCLSRGVGAAIFDPDSKRFISMGYNGAPPGEESCVELNSCPRKGLGSGQALNICRATHAEVNAFKQAEKYGIRIDEKYLFVTNKPCANCMAYITDKKTIERIGKVAKVIYRYDYPSEITEEIAKNAGIELIKFEG